MVFAFVTGGRKARKQIKRMEKTAMTTQTTQTKSVNGVNVDQLFENIGNIKAKPTLARFKFRLRNEWQEGGHNRSTIGDFYGVSQEHPRKTFELDADEPPVLLGRDLGPNPVEYLLHALASCVTTAMVYHAAARGIEIEEVECAVDGDIDLRGFLGIDKGVRKGYEEIRMNYKIKADVTDEQLQELAQLGPTFSPVFDTVTNGTAVTVTAERK